MANEEHLEIIKQGVRTWNAWRESHPDLVPDLSDSNLGGAHLTYGGYWPADLPKSAWGDPILQKPELQGINLRRATIGGAYFGQAKLQNANFRGAEGKGVDFREADLQGADFSSAGIQESNFWGANLREAAFEGYANFLGSSFSNADLRWSRLRQGVFSSVTFAHANLQHADLRESTLEQAILNKADLRYANLSGADLRLASLVETNLEESNLQGAKIYGISAWGLHLNRAKQSELVITPRDEPTVTVDDLEVAQFVYLLLNNQKIRQVIHSVTSKAVLILGRFTPERKAVLDVIRVRLREDYGLVPILFDWEPSENRDLTETVVTLAGMCRFIVADLTDAKSIPQELSHIIPTFQSVPIRPIILASQKEYSMYGHWETFDNVLPVFDYSDTDHLLQNLKTQVIGPVEDWEKTADKEGAKRREAAERERRLKEQVAKQADENAKQAARIAELEAQLKVQ